MKNQEWLGKRLAILSGTIAVAFAPGVANAFGMMEVGDWQVEFSGNINAFATFVSCENTGGRVAGGLACGSFNPTDRDFNDIRTGLLPSWFGFHAQREENGLMTGVTIGFQPGADGGNQGARAIDGGLGLNSANFRQVFLEFGSSWGKVKVGRELGLFGSDAILSDMTLLGVGTVSDLTQGGGNTSLGRIGVGYVYADWKGQIQYSSPSWNGFSFAVALVDPWGLVDLSGESLSSGSFAQQGDTYGFEGKAGYEWKGDSVNGKVWASFITQSLDTAPASPFSDQDATGFDIGGKVGVAGFEFVAYYYDGDGIGTTDFLFDAMDAGGNTRDSDGGYIQATYKFPGVGTKIGVSFGESNLDAGPADDPATSPLVEKNESFVIGVYHPLTPALNLVVEYTDTQATAHNGAEGEESSFAIGAIMFY